MSEQESIDAIQQRMRAVRGTMGEEVVDLVASTRDMTDWRQYVRANPWACVAAAVAVGYFLVPNRTKTAPMTEADLKKLLRAAPALSTEPPKSRLRGELISFVSHAAMRALMGYIGNRMAASSVQPTEPEPAFVRRTPK